MPEVTPSVDVLIPVRAPAPWLGEALTSVLQQTYPCRIIVVMDGASQEVRDMCSLVQPPQILVLSEVPPGSGIVAALNHGLRLSDAEYVARLDADDRCHPERIERQVTYLHTHPECAVVGSGVIPIDSTGSPLRPGRPPAPSQSVIRDLRWRTPLAHPSVMLRRRPVLDVGGYSPEARHVEDFDLWLRLAATGADLRVLPAAMLDYRLHPGQVTAHTRFSRGARRQILASRLAMARGRGESTVAARARHLVWVGYHSAKGR